MLRYSLDQDAAALRVEAAVRKVLSQGYRTGDIFQAGTRKVGTRNGRRRGRRPAVKQ